MFRYVYQTMNRILCIIVLMHTSLANMLIDIVLVWCHFLFFLQFGELGIDFVGLESRSPPPPEQASEGALSSLNISSSISTAAADPMTSVDTSTSQLTYSQLQPR